MARRLIRKIDEVRNPAGGAWREDCGNWKDRGKRKLVKPRSPKVSDNGLFFDSLYLGNLIENEQIPSVFSSPYRTDFTNWLSGFA